MSRPNFGDHIVEHESGGRKIQLSCKYVAPGLTFSDLMDAFHEAESHLRPDDHLSGNPSKWPGHRGVHAVAEAILNAIYR